MTIENIDQLIYLYSQGIEYYEATEPLKYKSFYDRLQKLLVWPDVFDVMKQSKSKKGKWREKEIE